MDSKSGAYPDLSEELSHLKLKATLSNEPMGIENQLCCKDFWPSVLELNQKIKRTVFERFSDLVNSANKWLSDKTDIQIKTIETVDKKCALVRNIYDGLLSYTDAGTHACYIKGLRIWYTKEYKGAKAGIQIGFFDAVPTRLDPEGKDVKFEDFMTMVKRLNQQFAVSPLNGHIISIDSVALKIARDKWKKSDGQVHPDETSWVDEYDQHILYILRIYYIIGAPTYETIGFTDFLPPRICGRGWTEELPKYEDFNTVFRMAQKWGDSQMDKRITNIQTLDTEYETGHGDDRMDSYNPFDCKTEDRPRINFIRVAYIMDSNNTQPVHLTYRNFVPGFKGKEDGVSQFQNVAEVMQYISAWVSKTNTKVVCAEMFGPSVRRLIRNHPQEIHTMEHSGEWFYTRDCENQPHGPYHHKLVYFLRVYFDGPYKEPDPSQLPEGPVLQSEDSCCIL